MSRFTLQPAGWSIAAATALCAGGAIQADTYSETFTGGSNEGNWSFFGDPANPVEVIDSAGGNPDEYLHATCVDLACLDSFAPNPRTQLGVASEFTGNYRDREVTSVGIDLILLDVDFGAAERPLTVMLTGSGVTAAFVGAEFVPEVGEGWRSFDFDIPADSLTLPDGWRIYNGTGDNDADWNTVITSVEQLGYFYGDPDFFFIFQQWEPGLDNPRITTGGGFAAEDTNEDGVVDVQDLLAVLGNWGACPDCPEDVDESGVVDVLDLLAVLGAWG